MPSKKTKTRDWQDDLGRIDRIIATRFTVSLMSNAKWRKLIDVLQSEFDEQIFSIRFKLVHEK